MTIKQRITPLLALVLTSVYFANAYADATIKVETQTDPVAIKVKGQRAKIQFLDSQQFGHREAVYDNQQNSLTIIDHAKQTIYTLDQAKLNQLGSTLDTASAVVQSQMENMTPEQQVKMEAMMESLGLSIPKKGADTAKIELIKTDNKQTVQASQCTQTNVFEGEQQLALLCITNGNSTTLSEQDFNTLISAQKLLLNLARQGKGLVKQFDLPNLTDINLNGLILKSEQVFNDGTRDNVFSVTEINKASVDKIQIPANYKTGDILGGL